MYGRIENPSDTLRMLATLTLPTGEVKTHQINPREVLPIFGSVRWQLWTLAWMPPPRKGLMRFRRS
jgi:hypothetical protein